MNPRVLILEPDALQRELMALALKRHHLEVTTCAEPQDAFQLIPELRPGLLVVDLLLRGQNGLDFINELKNRQLLQGAKILFVSPLGFPEIVLKAAKAGAAAFMIKPVDPEQLAEKVLSLLVMDSEKR